MSEEEEVWRPVVGYEGLYEVSSIGRIRGLTRVVDVICAPGSRTRNYTKRIRGKILSLNSSRENGYLTISLSKNGQSVEHSVHVLVAAAFLGPRPGNLDVAHGDGVKFNNRSSNLRYATRKENISDNIRLGKSSIGELNGRAKLNAEQVKYIRYCTSRADEERLCIEFGVKLACLISIRGGRRWKHI